MNKKLYVGNLPYQVDDNQLAEYFTQAGVEVLSAKVMIDRELGRSRGFGFVEVANEEEMNKAIEALDGKDMAGRPLRVNEAQPDKWAKSE